MVGGRVVTGGRREAVALRAFWIIRELKLEGRLDICVSQSEGVDLLHADQSSHGLDDRDGARNDRGIVPAAGGKLARSAIVLGSALGLGDGGRGLEGNPKYREGRSTQSPPTKTFIKSYLK